jgi:hypothetical protein
MHFNIRVYCLASRHYSGHFRLVNIRIARDFSWCQDSRRFASRQSVMERGMSMSKEISLHLLKSTFSLIAGAGKCIAFSVLN